MRCSRVRRKLILLVDGRLTGKQEAALYQHLEACPDCGRQFRELQKQVRLLGEPTRFSPPAELWPRLQNSLVAQEPAVERRSRILVYRPAVLAAAALVLVALFAWNYWPRPVGRGPELARPPVAPVGEVEELDLFLRRHKSLELENPLTGEVGIVALVTEGNNNGTAIY